MLEQSQIIPLFLTACPSFQTRWDAHRAWWAGEEAGAYHDLAALAHYLVDLARAQETQPFPAVFAIVERMIVEGDDQMVNLAVVGLLEGLQNISSNTDLDAEVFVPWLGPVTRTAWYDLIAYWDHLMLVLARRRLLGIMRHYLFLRSHGLVPQGGTRRE